MDNNICQNCFSGGYSLYAYTKITAACAGFAARHLISQHGCLSLFIWLGVPVWTILPFYEHAGCLSLAADDLQRLYSSGRLLLYLEPKPCQTRCSNFGLRSYHHPGNCVNHTAGANFIRHPAFYRLAYLITACLRPAVSKLPALPACAVAFLLFAFTKGIYYGYFGFCTHRSGIYPTGYISSPYCLFWGCRHRISIPAIIFLWFPGFFCSWWAISADLLYWNQNPLLRYSNGIFHPLTGLDAAPYFYICCISPLSSEHCLCTFPYLE